jgi:type II secretory pathway pseudopilin PulG
MVLNNNESGRSMIEMLGVLAIMGIITVAAIQMVGAAMRSQKRTTVQDDVAQMTTGVRQLLGDYDDFTGIDNNTIFAAIGMTNKTPYGGKYELAVDASNPRQFVVSITGLNTSDCKYFTTKAWPDSAEFRTSNGKSSGATASPSNCDDYAGKNTVRIIYGE